MQGCSEATRERALTPPAATTTAAHAASQIATQSAAQQARATPYISPCICSCVTRATRKGVATTPRAATALATFALWFKSASRAPEDASEWTSAATPNAAKSCSCAQSSTERA
eukprot:Amastigsp_a1562_3.p4 type:complete len:113 gc:universal Amastigsp_a1562_3:594-256(-)